MRSVAFIGSLLLLSLLLLSAPPGPPGGVFHPVELHPAARGGNDSGPEAWSAEALASIADRSDGDRLEGALAEYRKIAAGGSWRPLPVDASLKKGQTSPQVAELKNRLYATGDLRRPFFLLRLFKRTRPTHFDDATEAAVRRFQARHGLKADGIIGSDTIRALNVPPATRIRQIEINIARARSYPKGREPRAIWVNIPDFRLTAFEHGREVLSMRVVVGTEYDPTPVFSDKMTYVVFRPEWNIPKTIAVEEMLPRILEDPSILERNSLEVVERREDEVIVIDPDSVDWSEFETLSYDLRQNPGPRNPLGNIKFMLPNDFNVYLHDTPADSLFKEEAPTFSHGCIRVEKPLELARFALRPMREWTTPRIHAAMTAAASRTVTLSEPIPVHIVYRTAWVESDGTVQFREDVYNLDGTL